MFASNIQILARNRPISEQCVQKSRWLLRLLLDNLWLDMLSTEPPHRLFRKYPKKKTQLNCRPWLRTTNHADLYTVPNCVIISSQTANTVSRPCTSFSTVSKYCRTFIIRNGPVDSTGASSTICLIAILKSKIAQKKELLPNNEKQNFHNNNKKAITQRNNKNYCTQVVDL